MRSNKPAKSKKRLSPEEEEQIIASMHKAQGEKVIHNTPIVIECKTENQKKFTTLIRKKEIIIANGCAGTGKTFLSCAEALKLVQDNSNKFRKIILVKSVTTLEGEEIGFLKGSLEEKMAPFMYSFMSNFHKIIGKTKSDALVAAGVIEIQPIAYLRGRSIDNSIIIVDEAQNISIKNIRTILTRLGEDSKIILIGDSRQNDSKNKKDSALDFLCKYFTDIKQIGSISFTKEDIVRNPLIIMIEDKFDELEDLKIIK